MILRPFGLGQTGQIWKIQWQGFHSLARSNMTKRANTKSPGRERHTQTQPASLFTPFRGLLVVLGALIVLYACLPLGTALQFGGDEGYELMKGYLHSKGYPLYTQIWDDQPPVFTLILSQAFRWFGSAVLVPRLIAAGFGLIQFGAFYWLVERRSGRFAALLAVFFLLSSPNIALLSVSVMQETPAIGTALLSACLMFLWRKHRHWGWLLASGAIMGVALQIKYTAALMIPAIFVEIALAQPAGRGALWQRGVSRDLFQWILGASVLFVAIALVWARESFHTAFRAHLAAQAVPGMQRPEDFRLQAGVFWDHIECVAAALVGFILVAHRKRWGEFAFPTVLLATALAIHSIHRPWWDYYYLHLAVPLAWLAGFAVAEAILTVSGLFSASHFRAGSRATWKGFALCAVTALVLLGSERRLEAGIIYLRRRPTVDSDPIIAKMREYAGRTHWVCSQSVIYPFHAQLKVPPELAVVTLKRFWSGQITTKDIVDICRRDQPEQVVLYAEPTEDEWRHFLEHDYTLKYQDKDLILYVANRIKEK